MNRRRLRRRRNLIVIPLDWQKTATPVAHPVIPVLAKGSGTQLQTPCAAVFVGTRDQNPRTLEIYFQRRIKRELKGLILFITCWVEAPTMLIVLSKPYGCRRWRPHKVTYAKFKKDMWNDTGASL